MKEKTTREHLTQVNSQASNRRILYIITKSNFGGAQRYVFELAKRSKQEGFETAVAVGGDGVLIQKLKDEGITVFSLKSAQRDISIFKEVGVLFNLLNIVKSFKPDIMHLNSPKIGGLGAVIGRLCMVKKIIYTNHGWPFKEDRPMWQLLLIRTFSWLTILFNKKIIVLSETEKNLVASWPLTKNKLVVLPNGLSHFDALKKEDALKILLGSKYPVSEKTLIIGTISELHSNKGLTYAIEGIRQFIDHTPEQQVKFIIIGEGERRKELEKLIKEEGLEQHIVLCGHVDNARVYLKAFDIFLLSSVKEGLPYAILEAGISNVPVISTSVGAIPEIIKNFETGLLIPPKRPQEIKNALIYFIEHPSVVSSMRENLTKKITTTFDFASIYKKVLTLYS